MNWNFLKKVLDDFDSLLNELGMTIKEIDSIASQLKIVREFLDDRGLGKEPFLKKWSPHIQDFERAFVWVYRLAFAAVSLRTLPPHTLRAQIERALSGSLAQDFAPEQAKDFFYELEMAAALKRAGFTVELREPDIVVSGYGLSEPLGLACKYPSSRDQLVSHIGKGYGQIKKQNLRGCVALGFDILIMKEIYGDQYPPVFNFNNAPRHPRETVQDVMTSIMSKLKADQERDYPAEKPVNGAIVTWSIWGIYGTPAGYASLNGWELQCDASNPILPDLKIIVDALRKLDTEQLKSGS